MSEWSDEDGGKTRVPIIFDAQEIDKSEDYSFKARIRTQSAATCTLIRLGQEKAAQDAEAG
ncbi:MAG: hypothetical protein ACFBSD_00740 [Paracoccaceae bacterium]